MPRPPAEPTAPSAASTSSVATSSPTPTGTAASGEVDEARAAARRRRARRARTEPTRSATHSPADGGQEEHEQGGQHRREVEELVGAVDGEHAVEHQAERPRPTCRVRRTTSRIGIDSSTATVPDDHRPLEPRGAAELEPAQPHRVGRLVEVVHGAARRPVEEARVQLGEGRRRSRSRAGTGGRPGTRGRRGRWRRPSAGAGPRWRRP